MDRRVSLGAKPRKAAHKVKFGAVIVGAGRGERLAAGRPKCAVEVCGVPLLALAAKAFQDSASIDGIVLVVPADSLDYFVGIVSRYHFSKVAAVVSGGERRQDSVAAGLAALPSVSSVLIHDGARVFVSSALVDRVCNALQQEPAAFAALPVSDTLHNAGSNRSSPGPDRAKLIAAQTPQGGCYETLTAAHKWAIQTGVTVTDDVTLLRDFADIESVIVPGDPFNIKITHPDDLIFYRAQLEARAALVKVNND